MVFIAEKQTSGILKAGKRLFDLSSTPIATEPPANVGGLFPTPFAMLGNHLKATLLEQPIIRPIAAEGLSPKT